MCLITMFRKFVADEQVSGSTQVKSSVARAIRAKLIETMPAIEVRCSVIHTPRTCARSSARADTHTQTQTQTRHIFTPLTPCEVWRCSLGLPLYSPHPLVQTTHRKQHDQDIIDDLCPKKAALHEIKCKDHVKIYAVNEELLFFQQRDG